MKKANKKTKRKDPPLKHINEAVANYQKYIDAVVELRKKYPDLNLKAIEDWRQWRLEVKLARQAGPEKWAEIAKTEPRLPKEMWDEYDAFMAELRPIAKEYVQPIQDIVDHFNRAMAIEYREHGQKKKILFEPAKQKGMRDASDVHR